MEAAPHPWPALGVLLLRDGLVEKDDLEALLSEQHDTRQQRISGWRLGEILIERGMVTPADVARLVAEQYELPYLDLCEDDIDPQVTALLPDALVERFSTLPISRLPDGSLLLAVADPATVLFSDELRRTLGMPLRFAVVPPDSMVEAIAARRERDGANAGTSPSPMDDVVVIDRETIGGDAALRGLRFADRGDNAWPPLGALLVRDGLVSEGELEAALAQQRLSANRRLGEILVERGAVSRADVARLVAEQYELPFVDVDVSEIDPQIAALLPTELAERYSALPVRFMPDGSLLVAVADPTSVREPEEILQVLGARLSFAVAAPEAIETAIARLRHAGETPPTTATAEISPPQAVVELPAFDGRGEEPALPDVEAPLPSVEDETSDEALAVKGLLEDLFPTAMPPSSDAETFPEAREEAPTVETAEPETAAVVVADEAPPEVGLEDTVEYEETTALAEAPRPPEPETVPEPEAGEISAVSETSAVEEPVALVEVWSAEAGVARDEREPEPEGETEADVGEAEADASVVEEPLPIVEARAAEVGAEAEVHELEPEVDFEAQVSDETIAPPEAPVVEEPVALVETPAAEDRVEAEEREPEADLGAETTEFSRFEEAVGHAVALGASTIHLSPSGDDVVVRARFDGVLRVFGALSSSLGADVIAALRTGDRDSHEEVETAVLPTRHGDRATLQLRGELEPRALSELGMPADVEHVFGQAVHQPTGAVLVYGPGGSGRTTTVYAALAELAGPERALISIEDPVERVLPGVDQVDVDPRAGLTFAAGLRTILRSDADVVLVGELRDGATAQATVQAAMSGRLVLATVPAPTAAAAIEWLGALGVERGLLASALTCLVGQRLVRRICADCRETYYPSVEELAELGRPEEESGRRLLARGRGCPSCEGTGFSGRTGVFELLALGEDLGTLVARGAPGVEIERAALASGMRSLREEALRLCLDGITSAAEIRRVVGNWAA